MATIPIFRVASKLLDWLATDNGDGTATPSVALTSGGAGAYLPLPTTPTAITPSDSTDTSTTTARGMIVSVGGTLAIRGTGAPATTVSFTVVAGQYIPIVCSRVMAATTATVVGVGA